MGARRPAGDQCELAGRPGLCGLVEPADRPGLPITQRGGVGVRGKEGTKTPFWTGECIHTDQAKNRGEYDYNACGAATGVYLAETALAGSLPANAFGLHEVLGNVLEWLEDCWHGDYKGAPVDGSAWLEGGDGDCALRVLRGGSWNDDPVYLRSAYRFRVFADYTDSTLVFVSPGPYDPLFFAL